MAELVEARRLRSDDPAHLARLALHLARSSARAFSSTLPGNLLRMAGAALVIWAEAAGALILLDRMDGIAGWSTAEVLVLLGIADAGLGLGMLVAEALEPPTFSQQIREGRFDQALTRPMPPWLWTVASDLQIRNLGRTIAGVTVLGAAWLAADVATTVTNLLLALGAVLAMGITVAAILTIGAAITMWTIDGTEVLNSFTYGGAALAGWPLQIYGGVLRALFVWVVPVGAVVYGPTLWLVDQPGTAGAGRWLVAILPAELLLFCLLATLAWRAGLRHYTGTGS